MRSVIRSFPLDKPNRKRTQGASGKGGPVMGAGALVLGGRLGKATRTQEESRCKAGHKLGPRRHTPSCFSI